MPCFYLQEYDGPDRKARISLDVDLTGPILLIPKHAFSTEMMAGEFGHVKVTNSTRSTLGYCLSVFLSLNVSSSLSFKLSNMFLLSLKGMMVKRER